MRFGVFLLAAQFPDQDHTTVLESAIAAALAAEEAGFDDVWIAEHHFMSYGICPSAITLAGYLLGATRRIMVGTAVSVLSTQHPVALAEQAALLDQLSSGRFRLGVGRGGPWIDLAVFGTGLARYQHAFPESLDLLLTALSGSCLAACGPHFSFSRRRGRTATAHQPAPRGDPGCHHRSHRGTGRAPRPTSAARYARRRHGESLPHPALQPGSRRCSAPSARHISAALGYVADSQREALATMRRSLPRWLGPGLRGYRRVDGAPHHPRDPHEYTELLCRLHPVGTPEHCRTMLATTARNTGIDHVILLVEGAGDRARTLENIVRLGAEVLPELRNSG